MANERPSLSNWLAQQEGQPKATPEEVVMPEQNTGTFGDVIDLAQAGALESVSGAAEFVGMDTAADYLKGQAQEQYETLSPEMAKSMAKRFVNDDLTIGEGAKDWRAWLGQAAKLTGQMATTMIPGGAVGKGAQLLGAGAKLAKGAQAATLMAGGVATAGGMQGQGVADDINNMSFTDLQGSTEFKNLAIKYADQGMSATDAMTKARSEIADKAQDQVMYDPTLAGLNAMAGYVGDAAMGKLIKGSLGKSIKGNIAKGILAEAPTEGLQGGYGQYISNIAKGDAGLEQDAMQGVYAAALEEGLIAGGVGGAGGLAGGSGRAMLNRLDQRVNTQEKIENAASDSIKQLSDSGADENEIRQTVGPKLEQAAMNKGHDAEESAAIANQAIDYALGRTPSVRERQNSSLKRFQDADLTGLTPPDPAQYGLTPEDAELLIDPPPELMDPQSGKFLRSAPRELMQRYQKLANSEGAIAYEKAESDYRMGIRARAPGEIDQEIFGTPAQTAAATAEAGQPALPDAAQAPTQEGVPVDVTATQQLPPSESIFELDGDYQPTEAARRIREQEGTAAREDLIREQSTQEPVEGFQPRERMDEPTPEGVAAVQRAQLERQFEERQPDEEALRTQAFEQAEAEQEQADIETAAAIDAIGKPDEVKRQEQDVIEPQRKPTEAVRPGELTPQQQLEYYRSRGTQFGTLGKEPKLGVRKAEADSPRLAKKKQKRLDANLQTIYDRITQANPSVEPEIQQFGAAPNAAMAEAFARLDRTEKAPTKEEQISRIWDLADSGTITDEKAELLIAEVEGKAVEPEKAPEPKPEPEPEREAKPKSKKMTDEEKSAAIAKLGELTGKVKDYKPGKNPRSEAFKKTLAPGEKYSNVKFMAFIGDRASEYREFKGLSKTAAIGQDQGFTDFINDWVKKNASIESKIEIAAEETDTAPSDAQIEAENYKKGKFNLHGLTIAIENPKGSTRSGTDPDGNKWSVTMKSHYGDIKRTKGADGDSVDVFIGDKPKSKMVYVIDQIDPKTGKFDEHKVMLGFTTIKSARNAYKENYSKDWRGLGTLTPVKVDAFKDWLQNGDLTKPFAETPEGPDGTKKSKSLSDQAKTGQPTELSKAVIGEVTAKKREESGKYALKELSIETVDKAINNFSDGTDGYKDFVTVATYVANNIDPLQAEMSDKTKPQIFKLLGRGFEARYKSEKKDTVVVAAVRSLLADFRFFMSKEAVIVGSTNKETVLKELSNFTEEQFNERQKSRIDLIAEAKKMAEQRKEAIKDPKTLDDYRLYIRENGFDSLTDAQVKEVDTLFTEGRLLEQEKERAEAAEVEAVAGDISFEMTETTHSKSGEPRYVVNLTGERLEGPAYTEVNNKAKQFGGRYVNPVMAKRWGTAPGFQFINEDDRNSFASILSGESVSKAERQERRAEAKQDKRVTKLRAMAEDLDKGADAALNQDRKTNTAKRSAEAASAVANAYDLKDFAATMKAIANATEKGEVRLIGNLSTKIQLSELEYIDRRILWNIPKDKVDDLTYTDNMSRRHWKDDVSYETKVRYADYPTPSGNVARLKYLAGQMEERPGYKQAAKGIRSRIKELGDRDTVVMTGHQWESIVEKIKDFARVDKYSPGEWVKEAFLTADRLNKIGITGKPSLRYALRELDQVKSGIKTTKPKADPVKLSETEIKETLFANRNPWNDFFPTPESESVEVVELADIKPGMKVLEPSAGMGHIADKIRETGADVDVVEMASKLREHLALKDYNIVGDDFLEYKPTLAYDRIVMNPPFSKDQDIKHINHAYSMLKPGGKLVAVTSSMAGDKANTINKNFRQFLDQVSATETPIKEGAFKESFNPTSVNTKIIEIVKPEAETQPGLTDNENDTYKYLVSELGYSHDDAMAEINQYKNVDQPDEVDKALKAGIEIDFNDIQFSRKNGIKRKENYQTAGEKGLSQERTSEVVNDFLADYKGLADVNVLVLPDQAHLEEVLGTGPIDGVVSGTWDSGSNSVYIVASNHYSSVGIRRTLRHELVTHFGLMETLNDTEYNDLTKRVMSTRNIPALKDIWAEVNDIEHDAPDSIKAEEVIARMSEINSGPLRKLADKIMTWVMGALRRTGLVGKETITLSEIRDLINSIDVRLRDGNLMKRRQGALSFSRKMEATATQPTMTLEAALDTQQKSLVTAVKRGLSKVPGIDKLKQNKYAALTLRQLSEVGSSRLSELKGYVDSVNEMMVTQNVLAEEVADLTSEVSQWAKKNKEKSKVLFDMMHDATLGGVDPSKPFESMTEILGEEASRIERRLRSTGGEVNKDLTNRLKEVRDAIANEPHRQAEHARLREKYSKIPADSKAHFEAMKNHYAAQRGRMREALEKSIQRAQVEESVKKEMLRTIRFDNERAEKEIYFPLARFGDYWIDVADENGERRFMMYETEAEMEVAVKQLQDGGFSPKFGTKLSQSDAVGGASIGFVSDVIGNIKKMNLNDDAKKTLVDDVYQLYLTSMPDRSLRRSFIHRKGIAGFSQDAIRAMADQGFKQSRQQARLDHMDDLNGYMEDMNKKAEETSDVDTGRIYNEMVKRHEWVQNPQRGAWAQKLTGLGFVWLLGLTPAAALVNLTQNVQVALPVIGSKHGMAKTSTYMAKATADFFKAMPVYFKNRGKYGILGSSLQGLEKEAIREAIKQGAIDTTQAADLIGLAENPSAEYTGTWNKAMNMIGWAFQKAEVFNREVTFITAYRLAYNKSKDHDSAVKYAVKATWDSHFDYGSLNRARFMQSDIAAVALQFKQYSQNMSYYLYTNLIKSFKKGTPKAERDMARKQLMWTMVMTFGIGGMNALPLAVVTAPMAMAQAMFGDDDDPFDPDVELKKMLSDYFGPEVAEGMWYGASPSISGRISLDSLWWRENDRDLPADQAYLNAIQQALGPVLGGIGMSAARGVKDFAGGQYMRGGEQLMPKAAKDMLRTARYLSEGGVYNRAGDAIINDLTFAENLGQVAGFVPSRLVTQYDQNSAAKGYEMQAKNRRSQLMNAYYMAYRTKDTDAIVKLRKQIKEWNQSKWGSSAPITNNNIKQSIRRRLLNLKEMDQGVKIDERYKRLTQEYKYFG